MAINLHDNSELVMIKWVSAEYEHGTWVGKVEQGFTLPTQVPCQSKYSWTSSTTFFIFFLCILQLNITFVFFLFIFKTTMRQPIRWSTISLGTENFSARQNNLKNSYTRSFNRILLSRSG